MKSSLFFLVLRGLFSVIWKEGGYIGTLWYWGGCYYGSGGGGGGQKSKDRWQKYVMYNLARRQVGP